MPVTADFFEITPRNWRARLTISVDFMRELSRYSDPEELFGVFTRRMSQLYPTSRQVTITRRGLSAPQFRVSRFNLWKDPTNPHSESHRLPVYSGGILSELLYSGYPQVIDELSLDPTDPACDFFDGQRSLLSIPIFEQGNTNSMVIVARDEPAAFPREQVPELVWMSNMFGRSLATLALSDELQDANTKAVYEAKVIADLQKSLLPANTPRIPGIEVAVHYKSLHGAGGDYYDFFPLPDNRIGVLIADVSGHGTPAAVLQAITHTLAHSYAAPPEKPGEFLAHINHHLTRRYTGQTGHFVTAFYVVFDPRAGTMTYSNAGHHPCIRGQHRQAWDELQNSQGLPLGVAPRTLPYPEHVARFNLNDRVMLMTDGILEATNRSGEMFGESDYFASLWADTTTASELVKSLLEHLRQFTTGQPSRDDQTLLVIRRTEVASKLMETAVGS